MYNLINSQKLRSRYIKKKKKSFFNNLKELGYFPFKTFS